MTALKDLRVNLKRLRVAQKLSQEALAEKAGLEYKHYQKIEAGRWPGLHLKTVEALAEALGVRVSVLLEPAPPGTAPPPNLPGGRPRKRSKARRL